MSVPFYTLREDDSRGANHGIERWFCDHWKTEDGTRDVLRRNYRSVLLPWRTDKRYQLSQWNLGWKEEYCRCLDYLAPLDISCVASWKERSRYENVLVLKLKDGKHSGKMSNRDDFRHAGRSLAVLERQEGRDNPYIPENERERPRPLDEKLRSDLEWQSWNYWKIHGSQTSSSSSLTWWQAQEWQESQERHEWQGQ